MIKSSSADHENDATQGLATRMSSSVQGKGRQQVGFRLACAIKGSAKRNFASLTPAHSHRGKVALKDAVDLVTSADCGYRRI